MAVRSSSGWLLVGLIVLISVAILALAGITFALTEHLRSASLRQNQTRAIYLAQAGVMRAIYDIRRMTGSAGGVSFRDPATSAEYVVDAGPSSGTSDDNVFTLGGQAADFFLVNMKGTMSFPQASICGLPNRDRFQGWSVTNVLSSATPPFGMAVIVDKIKVDWNSHGVNDRVLRIDLNNTTVYSNCAGTLIGQDADTTTNLTINPRQTWSAGTRNRIWFNVSNVASGKTFIDLTFTMLTDGSTTPVAHYESTVANRSADVVLKAIGEVRKGSFPFGPFPDTVVWRRLKIRYRLSGTALTSTGNVVEYQELPQQTP